MVSNLVWPLIICLAAPPLEPASPDASPRGGTTILDAAAFGLPVDGQADATEALVRCFEEAERRGGASVRIPPGTYRLSGQRPIPLCSHLSVDARSARFILPNTLPDAARLVLFHGRGVTDLDWTGGHFEGRCFDPAEFDPEQPDIIWPPNANTRALLIESSLEQPAARIRIRDMTSNRLAGAAITVEGVRDPQNERLVKQPAEQISVDHCRLLQTGKFMWDYGYLWQMVVWPEEYSPRERALASRFFRHDLVRGPLQIAAGDDRVRFANNPPLPVTAARPAHEADRGHDAVCFFGDELPPELVRGKQYFVVESTPEFVRVAETVGGPPIRFSKVAGPQTRLIADLFSAHLALYAPVRSGPGKGAVDITSARHVRVTNCTLSALGDTMHIQRCDNVVFANNQITGSRMGAFFIAEYCSNVSVTGNTVDGTNGSRVMSVEKSTRDITITGNTFRNGGRGSWINQPENFVLTGNLFVNNTTKCEPSFARGRKTFVTGDFEQYAELYFTTHEPGGRYRGVIVSDNLFVTGPDAAAAMSFAPGGDGLLLSDNMFRGQTAKLIIPADMQNVTVRDNVDLTATAKSRLKN